MDIQTDNEILNQMHNIFLLILTFSIAYALFPTKNKVIFILVELAQNNKII